MAKDWNSIWDEVESERKQRLATAYTGTDQHPDQAARANRLSDQLGQPYGVVAANLAEFEQDARRQEINVASEASPHVAEFLTDQRRMALASDEAPKLASYAQALSKPQQSDWADQLLGNILQTGVGVYGNVQRLMTGRTRSSDVQATGDVLRSFPAGAVRGVGMAVGGVGEAYNLSERTLGRAIGQSVRTELAPDDWSMLLHPGDALIRSGQDLKSIADWIAPPRERQHFGTQVAEGIGQVIPMLAQAMLAPQTLTPTTFSMGFDQMADATRKKDVYGTSRGDLAVATGGLAIGTLERVGVERLLDRVPPRIREPGLRYLADMSAGALIEGSTEAAQQVAQNAAIQTYVAPEQSLTEGVVDNAAAGGAVGAIIRGVLGLPGVPRSQTRAAAEQLSRLIGSQDGNARLAAATQAATELKLGERSPEDLKALTAQIAGEDARIYLDAEQAQTLFQSAPQVLHDMVGGPQALAEQLAIGQVSIPMHEWMAAVPRLPNRDEILRNARTTPDGLSPAELEGLDVESMARELGVPLEAPAPDQTSALASDQVQQDVLAQLVSTGRYTDAQADTKARLWGAMFGRLGEVTGQDPMALYQRYFGGVQARQPTDVATDALQQAGRMTIDARGRQTIERDGSRYVQRAGQWLLADEQGEPRDFLTLNQARTEAERIGGEAVQDDPIEGQRQTWSVALPEVDARAIQSGDILFQAGQPAASITGAEFGPIDADVKVLRAAAKAWYDANLRGTSVVNEASGREVKFAKGGKAFSTSANPEKVKLFAALPELLKKGEIKSSKPPADVSIEPTTKAYHWLEGTVKLSGRAVRVGVTLREDAAGTLYYNHNPILESEAPGGRPRWSPANKAGPGNRNAEGYDQTVPPENDGINLEILDPAPRGQIRIAPDRSMQISLFEKADLSTFLHESGHFFLEVYRDLADQPDAPLALREDFGALLRWFGVASADQIGTEQHEQFARGFETYLGEGKAPTPELQSIFSQFKQWILGIYRSLRNLNVELTDEVRGVFDRMLASEEEIAAAQARTGYEPIARDLTEAKALGMTEKQFADYQAQVAVAREQAEADVLAQLQAADARASERWWKDERAVVRAEVQAEVEAMPIVRAYRVLTGRKEAAGAAVPEPLQGLKLDKAALVATYGEGQLDKLGRVYAKKGGGHPDEAAALLGFNSGDELVQGLWTVQQTLAGVDAEADARMRARHGDPMTDGTLAGRALDAMHNSRRIQLLERELNLLADLAREPRPNRRELKAVAEALIARKTLRQLRPNEYLVAERKAARQATEAATKGKYGEALLAKRRQALNAALYAQARATQQQAESTTAYLRKAASDKTRERVGKQAGKDYVEALDAIFAGIETGQVSGRQVARRTALRDWVRKQQEAGNSTAVSEDLLARVESESVTNIADMPFADVEQMREAVENLLHLARLKNKLRTVNGQREWEDVKAEILDRLQQRKTRHGRRGLNDADKRLLERGMDAYASGANWMLQPETLVEWADGGVSGPLHDSLWEPSEEAENHRNELKRRVGKLLKDAIDGLSKEDRRALDLHYEVAGVDPRISGHSIISALLNMGNAGNRDKLLRGGRVVGDEIVPLTEIQLADMFAKLSAGHARLVQGIWDAVDSLWPDIVAMEEKLSGIAPEKVQAQAFTVMTKDGPVPLRGGYYPVRYDPAGAKAAQFSEDEQAKRVLSGQTGVRATTSKGHTETRTDFVAPLLLDWNAVLTTHLDGVMSDIAYRQFLSQANKILRDADIRRAIDNRIGDGATKGLLSAMERGATGSFFPPGMGTDPLSRITNKAMVNASVAALGFRVPLALANIVTAPILATARVKPRFLASGLWDYYTNMRASIDAIHSLSPMMLKRSEARSAEYGALLDTLRNPRGKRLKARLIEMSMAVHQWIVPLAENAIWLSAYKQAQAEGLGATGAVRIADKAIRQTQTKHSYKDLSAAEANPYLKPLMMFAGPTVIINNRLQESGLRGMRGMVTSPAQALGAWLAMAAGGSWLFELMMGRGPDDDDDDDDGLDIRDWTWWAAKNLAMMPFAGIPGVRDAVNYLDKGYVTGAHPLVAVMKRLDGFGKKALDEDDGLFTDDPDWYDLAQAGQGAVSSVVPIPSNQIKRTGDYLMEVGTGERTPENPAADAYYLMQGPPKED